MKDMWLDIDWEKFHFLRAEYLWFVIPVILVILLGILFYGDNARWKKHIAIHLQPYVIQKGTTWKVRFIHISLLVLFAIAFISFLGPTWAEEKAPAKKVASKLVIALDLSQSMLTDDVSPNRLERAKFKIHDLLDANPRAETALLVFSASTHTVVPFTTDCKILIDNLDGLQPTMMPHRGTGFKALFTKLDSMFVDNKAPGRLLIFTDDLSDLNPADVSDFVQNNNASIHLYPLATEDGGHVPSFYNSKVGLNVKGKLVSSKLNIGVQEALKQIDSVTIMEMTLDKSDVRLFAESVSDHLIFEEKSKKQEEHWQDNGYWLLIPLMILFLFSFRKGWSLMGLIICFGMMSCQNSETDSKFRKSSFHFKDLWYTKAYQAQQDYNIGEYTQAAIGFQDPMHKGAAYYKAGNFTKAKAEFEKDSTVNGQYNLGLTYAKLGDLEKAQQVFEVLVKAHPEMKQADNNLQNINEALLQKDQMSAEDSTVEEEKPMAQNKQNDSPEDLGGGGQKATKKDMEKQRLEETVNTGKRKGKELDELPDDFESGKGSIPKNILMRKVDDDPALFLKRKFQYQVKHNQVDVEQTQTSW